MASAWPVFPEVGSTIVPPGFSTPRRSASSIMRSPIRSLTLPPGLSVSTFARMVGRSPAVMRWSRTSGVCPTASRMLPRTCTAPHCMRRIGLSSAEGGSRAGIGGQFTGGLRRHEGRGHHAVERAPGDLAGAPDPDSRRGAAKERPRDDAGPGLLIARGLAPPTRPDVGRTELKRLDCLKAIYPRLEGCAVVTIMGAVAAELYSLGHRANFFYLEHAMGLASSMGLGIALSMPEHQVIVLDGDGSLLMNLGTLSTMARYKPGNLLHIVFDNESLLSVGGFPTATSSGTNLADIARASGVPSVKEANTIQSFQESVTDALKENTLTTIVSKVEAISPKSFHMDLALLENRFQFWRSLQEMRKQSMTSKKERIVP